MKSVSDKALHRTNSVSKIVFEGVRNIVAQKGGNAVVKSVMNIIFQGVMKIVAGSMKTGEKKA